VPKEHLVEEYATDPLKEGRTSASQSPAAQRGGYDAGAFKGDRSTNMNIKSTDDTDSAHTWERATPLNIEKTLPKQK
jgi:hypothetical protein